MNDIIVDIDGTVADQTHRRHYLATKPKNWKMFNRTMDMDTPHRDIIWLVQTLWDADNRIIMSTGRTEDNRKVTEDWLDKYIIPYHALYMRAEKDYRDDSIIKLELLDQMRIDGYDPTMVLDDRNRVVDAYRKAGLRVLQVAPGDF